MVDEVAKSGEPPYIAVSRVRGRGLRDTRREDAHGTQARSPEAGRLVSLTRGEISAIEDVGAFAFQRQRIPPAGVPVPGAPGVQRRRRAGRRTRRRRPVYGLPCDSSSRRAR